MTKKVVVRDLGRMDYKPCWDLQEEVFQGMVKAKIARRNAGLSTIDPGPEGEAELALPTSTLFWVEHPHVLTLGKSGRLPTWWRHLRAWRNWGFNISQSTGWSITYHGPGQWWGTRFWTWINSSRTSTNTSGFWRKRSF